MVRGCPSTTVWTGEAGSHLLTTWSWKVLAYGSRPRWHRAARCCLVGSPRLTHLGEKRGRVAGGLGSWPGLHSPCLAGQDRLGTMLSWGGGLGGLSSCFLTVQVERAPKQSLEPPAELLGVQAAAAEPHSTPDPSHVWRIQ